MAMSSHHLPTTTTLFTLSSNRRPHLSLKPQLSILSRKNLSLFLTRCADNGAGIVVPAAVVEEKVEKAEETPPPPPVPVVEEKKKVDEKEGLRTNGAAVMAGPLKFKDPRWVGGTWDLKQFQNKGTTDWDAVIDAEARRRKWLEDNPEATSNDEPVVFDTSIVPWWAWMKRFHLPEAELLNGRAAMIGFFMAYFVDSLTGVGLVDQMGNFFCKTLLFISVVGVLVIRKNEDLENIKKLIDETTFYDKQWQATWKEDAPSDSNKE